MFEVRMHGRGGQGMVTAAELLSVSAFRDGFEAQAFPSFGSERMGAPLVAFCRIAGVPIRVREPVTTPDAVIVADSTLLHHVDLFGGLAPGGYVLVNSSRTVAELGITELADGRPPGHVISVPASALANKYLSRPLPNICLLGAFAALTGAVSIDSIAAAAVERFAGAAGEANARAARAAFMLVEGAVHA
jgi:pyruvate ferredoxin oxidoreductase gamma subunit